MPGEKVAGQFRNKCKRKLRIVDVGQDFFHPLFCIGYRGPRSLVQGDNLVGLPSEAADRLEENDLVRGVLLRGGTKVEPELL